MSKILYKNSGAVLEAPEGRPVFLSGGFGSEVNKLLAARGIHKDTIQKGSDFIAPLHAPEIVERVHTLYALAGADILTADTFNASVSRQKGDIVLVREIIEAAAQAANNAAEKAVLQGSMNRPLVALSLTSSGDCYTPADTPLFKTLIEEHAQNIALLKPHGDFILAETIPTLREARIIADLCQQAGKPFMVAFAVDNNGNLRDGSKMIEVVETVLLPNSYCMGVGANCCPPQAAENAASALKKAFTWAAIPPGKHILAYPNGHARTREENAARAHNGHSHGEILLPTQFTQAVKGLIFAGAHIVGGCCGAGPEHVEDYTQLELPTSRNIYSWSVPERPGVQL